MRPNGLSIFSKMLILIVLLLLPVVYLYLYFNSLSESNTKKEIQQSAASRLAYSLNQIESSFDSMMLLAGLISQDASLRELEASNFDSDLFDRMKTETAVAEKIQMLSASGKWKNDITLFLPGKKQAISTLSSVSYEIDALTDSLSRNWSYRSFAANASGSQATSFVYHLVGPLSAASELETANYVIEIRVPGSNLIGMLGQFKAGNTQGDPFLFNPDTGETILNASSKPDAVKAIIGHIAGRLSMQNATAVNEEMTIDGRPYLINAKKSSKIGWYLVDYTPLSTAFSSIANSRNVFYLSVGMLLLMAVVASFMFYWHVQTPVTWLVRGVQSLKKGDYSARIPLRGPSEFRFLFERFNGMASEIQTLIENVYQEKLRSREATLKQLQAQINPHFLYNCLFFIKNMSGIGHYEAVEKMSVSLGEFYRYVTRTEKRLATVREEAEFVRHYLNIQHLRMPRLKVEWEISEDLFDLEIPRLLIQPIVENAIVHGIENIKGEGLVKIEGKREGTGCLFTVEDNGKGMTPEQMDRLQQTVTMPLSDEMGCGVWNINQRLIHEFGAGAKLHFFQSPLGGLGVRMSWNFAKEEE